MISKKTILIVEDNAINRMMLCAILTSNYRILEAENGQEALDILEKHYSEISLILLDIVMPVMDGYTFLSKYRENAVFSSIPVIVTTQSSGEVEEVTALSLGATDFVAKPYKRQIILHRVAGIIRLRETAAMLNQFKYDRLTGVYSKEFFYQESHKIIQQNPDKKYNIICSDIENFKLVNDIYGSDAGDLLLCSVADVYRKLIGDHGIFGRLDADRFACLLENNYEYTDDMFIKAGSMINFVPKSKAIVLKWGVYEVKDISIPIEQMCDRALLAARSIKGQYGKHFARYDGILRAKLLKEQQITDSMESALASGQFLVYFQPKYRIKDCSLSGAEALVRWNHPEWGLQPPSQFIPLFEKNGFIPKLDRFVWEKVCAELKKWDDKGYEQIPISVNVSRADIYNDDFEEILLNIVSKYDIEPSRLHLEITESAYTDTPDQIIQTVGELRRQGFVIEMDDFGSGYSSLNMLSKMPLDVLKLDMKFIQNEKEVSNDKILRFIIDLAKGMDLSVVAEGVETLEQFERLKELECDQAQGYFFAKPMPALEFEKFLHKD